MGALKMMDFRVILSVFTLYLEKIGATAKIKFQILKKHCKDTLREKKYIYIFNLHHYAMLLLAFQIYFSKSITDLCV